MTYNQKELKIAADDLVNSVASLGFPEELGYEMAKNLGSPKAIRRMNAYLRYEKPKSVEVIVDEMLAIKSEIENWKERKEAQNANAMYNEMKYYGLFDSEDE